MINENDELLKCKCGSVLFTNETAYTFEDNKFIVYGAGSKVMAHDSTISFAKCLSCNRLHAPRTSMNGRNRLDRVVEVYEQLLTDIARINAKIDATEAGFRVIDQGPRVEETTNVQAEPISGAVAANDVPGSPRGSRRGQNLKKSPPQGD